MAVPTAKAKGREKTGGPRFQISILREETQASWPEPTMVQGARAEDQKASPRANKMDGIAPASVVSTDEPGRVIGISQIAQVAKFVV